MKIHRILFNVTTLSIVVVRNINCKHVMQFIQDKKNYQANIDTSAM